MWATFCQNGSEHMKTELERVSQWARERLRSGAEPPTAYYRLMQLIEAADALSGGLMATPPKEGEPESVVPAESAQPQEGSVVRLDNARRHPAATPIRLPT